MIRLKAIQRQLVSLGTKVKALFYHQRWHNALTFFGFVFVSFIFWMMIRFQEQYETKLSLPIRYTDLPSNIILKNNFPQSISVHIEDKGNALIRYSFFSVLKPIHLSKANLDTVGKHILLNDQFIESHINEILLPTTKLIGFSPKSIELDYGLRKSKNVPVVFSGDVRYSPGFKQSGALSITPKEVKIHGTEEDLARINVVETSFIDVEKADNTIEKKLLLNLPANIYADQKEVEVRIPIEAFMQEQISLPITCSNLPSDYLLRVFPPTASIIYVIPLSRSQDISVSDFEIDLNFDDLNNNLNGLIPISLTRKPEWINQVSIEPKEIEFMLEHKLSKQPQYKRDSL